VSNAIKTYRDLIVWQKAMALVTAVYHACRTFPKEELYALTSQIKRAAISVPSNIAEGYGRRSTGDYVRFLQIAAGSLFELQTQLELALNLGYFTHASFDPLYEASREIERMLSSLIRKLNHD
jgi:four helix bundle protein